MKVNAKDLKSVVANFNDEQKKAFIGYMRQLGINDIDTFNAKYDSYIRFYGKNEKLSQLIDNFCKLAEMASEVNAQKTATPTESKPATEEKPKAEPKTEPKKDEKSKEEKPKAEPKAEPKKEDKPAKKHSKKHITVEDGIDDLPKFEEKSKEEKPKAEPKKDEKPKEEKPKAEPKAESKKEDKPAKKQSKKHITVDDGIDDIPYFEEKPKKEKETKKAGKGRPRKPKFKEGDEVEGTSSEGISIHGTITKVFDAEEPFGYTIEDGEKTITLKEDQLKKVAQKRGRKPSVVKSAILEGKDDVIREVIKGENKELIAETFLNIGNSFIKLAKLINK